MEEGSRDRVAREHRVVRLKEGLEGVAGGHFCLYHPPSSNFESTYEAKQFRERESQEKRRKRGKGTFGDLGGGVEGEIGIGRRVVKISGQKEE